ncbi:MAG: DUF6242 domain-containing protein [Bacteroides sp.]|nr:DUF6242 domain-containing protein [Bacteroides sp.]MCM1414140.1 DUF6242 domain-containing protein [Bacteroides sp.]MCM1471006.1 DUF6242 domain-containing protein [Bacteroides sp.]
MKRRFPLYILMAMLMASFTVACNDDDDDVVDLDDISGNALMINTFKLRADDSVLVNLDSVFFSIDLNNAVVFNADSLPKGTKVDRLIVDMTTSAARKAEITMPGSTGADTVVNYLTNPTDSINFSRGSVKLHLESANGEYTRDYTIYVNVHKMDPDMMVWSELSSTDLPTSLSAPESQRTVELGGKVLCFTQQGSDFCRATADDPSGSWTKTSVQLPSGADLSTMAAGENSLYVVASGQLYTSTDAGSSWTSLATAMTHIYGVVNGKVIGVNRSGNDYQYVTYPAKASGAVEPGCPVKATSPAIVYTTEWSDNAMLIVGGGLDASGNPVGALWAYDGGSWAQISVNKLPETEAPMVVPYYAYKTATNWKVTRMSVLLYFGGRDANGISNKEVYISYDLGIHWSKASDTMQLPATYSPGAYAQAVVYNRELTADSRAASRWIAGPFVEYPAFYRIVPTVASRATTPITSWDCPYIYVFGGIDKNDALNQRIWRGVLNRLTFKPLQ